MALARHRAAVVERAWTLTCRPRLRTPQGPRKEVVVSKRDVDGRARAAYFRTMSRSRKPSTDTSAEIQRLANRLATMVASELPPHHSATLTVIGPSNSEDHVRNVSATAVRHAKPQLLEAPTKAPKRKK